MMNSMEQIGKDVCEINIYPEKDLLFNVRVALNGKTYLKGGFMDPEEAQMHGVKVMLTMTGHIPGRLQ